MELSKIAKDFFGTFAEHLPVWGILAALGIIVAAYIIVKYINRPTPTVSISNSTVGDVAGRDVKKTK